MTKKQLIRSIYLYLFSLVGLVLLIIGSVRLVNLGLKAYVFTEADIYYSYPSPERIPVTEDGEEIKQPTKEEIAEHEEKQRTSNRQRDAAQALAFLIIGAPLYIVHWRLIKKDKSE
ncbi:MAG: hypothetical protein WDZ80_05135 [Candidatus Paceibacterota bacterium]